MKENLKGEQKGLTHTHFSHPISGRISTTYTHIQWLLSQEDCSVDVPVSHIQPFEKKMYFLHPLEIGLYAHTMCTSSAHISYASFYCLPASQCEHTTTRSWSKPVNSIAGCSL